MIRQSDRLLAEQLVKSLAIPEASSEKFLKDIDATNESLRTYLVRHGHATEQQVLQALSAIWKYRIVDLKSMTIEKDAIDKVPVRFAWYYKFMPVKLDGKKMVLAVTSPMDVKVQDEIKVNLGVEPQMVLAKEADIVDAQNKYYGLAADTIERLSKETDKAVAGGEKKEEKEDWIEELDHDSDESSVARLVNKILVEAHKKRSTDIHIEPYRNKVRVRYRIDGVLVDANVPQEVKKFILPIISRIKIMANLSIVEKRIPQDGSAVVKTKEQDLDLRISTIPTPRGESMVIRILPTDVTLLSLEKLGLDSSNLTRLRELLKRPHGIVLVTGPTGSGKTTTLYACLNEINEPERKIITLEDPLEYELEGLTQIQVNTKVDLDFARGLRAILRHDPDIIMVGEIRDRETAEIAIRTALTGHLVFSTLHTNDASSGVTRLVEMGLEPFLVVSSVEAFIAQRLIRLLCPECKVEVKELSGEIKKEISLSLGIKPDEIKAFEGKGCNHCNGTGYFARTAIYETLIINEDIREAILNKKRAEDIKKIAMQNGMITLRQAGWGYVAKGKTSIHEVLNSAVRDDLSFLADSSHAPTESKKTKDKSKDKDVRFVPPEVLSAKDDYNSRVYQRLEIEVGIRYSLVRQSKDNPHQLLTEKVEHSSVTKDISAGGLRFVSGYTIPIGTIIQLQIQLERGGRSVNCLAKVCRVEDDQLSSMFHLVVYYLDMSSGDRVKVEQFVRSQMKKT